MTYGKLCNLDIHQIILDDAINVVSNDKILWNKLKSKTVLITGASGLIGSYLVYTLLCANEVINTNIKILALVRNREKAEAQFAGIMNRDDFMLLTQDVVKPIEYVDKIHYIIHAASKTGPKDMMSDPVGTITANTIGTLNLLECARKNNAVFLYLSSREIYGNTNSDKTNIIETEYGTLDPTLVRSCYPESKRIGETLCSSYMYQYNVDTKIARLSHVYGPDNNLGSGRVWGEFLVNEVLGENIVIKSAGLAELIFMYVSDAVSGLFFVLLNSDDMVYNISDSSGIIQIRKLAELISGLNPEKNLRPVFEIENNSGCSKNSTAYLNSSKIEKLGWKPIINLNDGFLRSEIVFSEYLKNK